MDTEDAQWESQWPTQGNTRDLLPDRNAMQIFQASD